MPVEIKQLIIRAIVEEDKADNIANNSINKAELSEVEMRITENAVKEVLRILKLNKNR